MHTMLKKYLVIHAITPTSSNFKNVFFFVFTYQILKTQLSQRRASSSSLLELLLVLMRRRRPDETPLEHRAVQKESDNIPDSASPNSIMFLTTAETFSKGIHIQLQVQVSSSD